MRSTIRLFRAVPITTHNIQVPTKELLENTMVRGFVFSPEVIFNYTYPELNRLITLIETEVGLTPEELNVSFHKSWGKVKEASIELLVLEQLIHYMTTYGFEALGIYNEASVYIPNEKLDIPELDVENFNFTVIRGYTKEELKVKILDLLQSGIALDEETIKDVVDVAMFVGIDENDVETIKNKETKILLYEYLGIVPESPIEFLRYLVFKATDSTLLIKNKETIEKIKDSQNVGITRLFIEYNRQHGFEKLATIFYRFKPLFLAFKTNTQLNHYINRIRKLATKHHRPMRRDYLNDVTAMIKNGTIDEQVLREQLQQVNIFRKIRLAYALKYRTKDVDSILYKIRNGKGYVTNFNFEEKEVASHIYDIVKASIVTDIQRNVEGKKIFIPDNVIYALPATEKQFTGNFPAGTCIVVPRNMVLGVHWKNTKGRVDLDLSLVNSETGKIGWDSDYRTDDRSVLFSGDITNASGKGATELFYVQKQVNGNYILFLNYFNYKAGKKCPFKILIASEVPRNFSANYMVDPSSVISIASSEINKKQLVLGLITFTLDECRFYFAETYLGNAITSDNEELAENSRNYLSKFFTDTISLNEVLGLAGAELIDTREGCDIDLSLETLEKDKIIKILYQDPNQKVKKDG